MDCQIKSSEGSVVGDKDASRNLAAALAIAMLFGGMANLPARAQITIGIIGDQTGAANLDQAYGVLQQGVAALKGKQLDVVLPVGDLIESTKSEAEIRTLFVQATTNLAGLGVPWYLTPGDHDVNPPIYQQNSTDRSRETLFKQLYGAFNPVAAKNLYYSFDVKGYHIVVLDYGVKISDGSADFVKSDPRLIAAYLCVDDEAEIDVPEILADVE